MRTCKICGETDLAQGFIVDGLELAYYCSEECLHVDFTEEEYLQAYNEDWAYWTQWEGYENE